MMSYDGLDLLLMMQSLRGLPHVHVDCDACRGHIHFHDYVGKSISSSLF